MQTKKAARLVGVFSRALRALALQINGVSLTLDNPVKPATTYYALTPSLLKVGDEKYLRVDWKVEPSTDDLRKATMAFNRLNQVVLLGKRKDLTATEVFTHLAAMTDAKRMEVLLKIAARTIRLYPDVAEAAGVHLDKPA